jgi:hypothetical protein
LETWGDFAANEIGAIQAVEYLTTTPKHNKEQNELWSLKTAT